MTLYTKPAVMSKQRQTLSSVQVDKRQRKMHIYDTLSMERPTDSIRSAMEVKWLSIERPTDSIRSAMEVKWLKSMQMLRDDRQKQQAWEKKEI